MISIADSYSETESTLGTTTHKEFREYIDSDTKSDLKGIHSI